MLSRPSAQWLSQDSNLQPFNHKSGTCLHFPLFVLLQLCSLLFLLFFSIVRMCTCHAAINKLTDLLAL